MVGKGRIGEKSGMDGPKVTEKSDLCLRKRSTSGLRGALPCKVKERRLGATMAPNSADQPSSVHSSVPYSKRISNSSSEFVFKRSFVRGKMVRLHTRVFPRRNERSVRKLDPRDTGIGHLLAVSLEVNTYRTGNCLVRNPTSSV